MKSNESTINAIRSALIQRSATIRQLVALTGLGRDTVSHALTEIDSVESKTVGRSRVWTIKGGLSEAPRQAQKHPVPSHMVETVKATLSGAMSVGMDDAMLVRCLGKAAKTWDLTSVPGIEYRNGRYYRVRE